MNLKSSHSHLCGLIVFVSLLLPACQQKPDEQAYWTKVEAYANAYQLQNNLAYLDSAYNYLYQHPQYLNQELNTRKLSAFLGSFMYSQRYAELENIIDKHYHEDAFIRNYYLNLIRALKAHPQDSTLAKDYIKNNITLTYDRILQNPADSLRLLEYYGSRIYLLGKDSVLKEVDYLITDSAQFSTLFYDQVLKEAIINYPEQFLF